MPSTIFSSVFFFLDLPSLVVVLPFLVVVHGLLGDVGQGDGEQGAADGGRESAEKGREEFAQSSKHAAVTPHLQKNSRLFSKDYKYFPSVQLYEHLLFFLQHRASEDHKAGSAT